jgi:hypothetical protein
MLYARGLPQRAPVLEPHAGRHPRGPPGVVSLLTTQTKCPPKDIYVCLRETDAIDLCGWALQEKILSRRIVSYSQDMLNWDCVTMEASGHMPEGLSGQLHRSVDYQQRIQEAINEVVDLADEKAVNEIYAAWYHLTMEFRMRRLTQQKRRVDRHTRSCKKDGKCFPESFRTATTHGSRHVCGRTLAPTYVERAFSGLCTRAILLFQAPLFGALGQPGLFPRWHQRGPGHLSMGR